VTGLPQIEDRSSIARSEPETADSWTLPIRLGWFSKLSGSERRTWFACFGGLGLDAMDSQAYALAIPALLVALHLTKTQAGTFATASLIGSGAGGWFFGWAADRYGRIRMFQLSIIVVALATFSSAFATTYWHLVVARTIQGIGYGGEAAIGAVLISETIRPSLRGRATASVQSGYAVGYALAVGFMAVVFNLVREAIAWRILFALGILPVLFLFYVRSNVSEPALYVAAEKSRSARPGFSVSPIFQMPLLTRTVIATVLSTGIFGGAYILITWLPTYMRTVLHLSVTTTAGYLLLNITGSFLGPIIYGNVSDKIGRRRSFVLFLVLQAVAVGIYTLAPIALSAIFLMGFLVGTLQGALGSSMLPAFAELYPTVARGHGQGFCLSIGRGMASLLPAGVGFATKFIPLGKAMGGFAVASYFLAIVAALLLPETAGKDLSEA
jgi:MFS family permease